jgi:hypothetical protein
MKVKINGTKVEPNDKFEPELRVDATITFPLEPVKDDNDNAHEDIRAYHEKLGQALANSISDQLKETGLSDNGSIE